MGYIDKTYYDSEYIGEPVDDADFPRYLARAEEVVDSITRYKVAQKELSTFNDFTQRQFQKAVAAQVEYYALEGIDIANAGITSYGFTVGKVSINGGNSASGKGNLGKTTTVCPKVCELLEHTGLLYRGVQC